MLCVVLSIYKYTYVGLCMSGDTRSQDRMAAPAGALPHFRPVTWTYRQHMIHAREHVEVTIHMLTRTIYLSINNIILVRTMDRKMHYFFKYCTSVLFLLNF